MWRVSVLWLVAFVATVAVCVHQAVRAPNIDIDRYQTTRPHM